MLKQIFRKIRKMRFAYRPLVEILISRSSLLHNFGLFRSWYSNCAIAPVLKSNAYGHGLVPVAKILDSEHPPFLCVDSYFEALTLRNEGVRSPILILGFTPLENIKKSHLAGVSFAILSLAELEQISKSLNRPRSFHLEINTGMNRHGIGEAEIGSASILVKANKNIRLVGAYSHLADADSPGSSETAEQISRWNGIVEIVRSEFPSVRWFHLSATAGSVYAERINANAMRIGLGLFGISPIESHTDLAPALEFKTVISSVRKINSGDKVGYNGTFTAEKQMTIATIPAGYSEGIDLRLSNTGFVSVRGVFCPYIGKISMNIATLDVSGVPEIQIGDDVTVFSSQSENMNSILKTAETCKTIPYEILVHIPSHLRRIIT